LWGKLSRKKVISPLLFFFVAESIAPSNATLSNHFLSKHNLPDYGKSVKKNTYKERVFFEEESGIRAENKD